MTVFVHYFAILRELVGETLESFEVPENSTGDELLREIGRRHNHMRDLLKFVRIADSETYLSTDSTLEDGATILLIPPVSGG